LNESATPASIRIDLCSSPGKLRHLGNINYPAFSVRLIPEQKRAASSQERTGETRGRTNDVTSEPFISFSSKPSVSRRSPGVAAKLIVAFSLLGLASASAAVITFDVVGGTLADGSTFTGTITVDNTAGTVTATHITFAGPDAPDTCSGVPFAQFPFPPPGYFIEIGCAPGATAFVLIPQSDPTGDLLGYTGGPISVASSLLTAPPSYVTGGVLVPSEADTAFQVSYAANLNIGESNIDITNTGFNGAAAAGPGFGSTAGDICVNVYAVDPGEELISCCSCLITPDATANLGVVRDLTSNTQTGATVTSVTVKLYGTLPVAGALPGSVTCNNSAAGGAYAGASILNGMAAFGTTLHARPSGSYATTERPFTSATLSATELASLQGRCASIIGNASGFGVCASCRAGALGAGKLTQ
jgi:hypothetical protein